MGYWSYPVPEFEWRHFVFGGGKAYADEMNKYDVIFQEDTGPYHLKNVRRPRAYLAIDSTLSNDHLESRLKRAENADLILVEQDKLERFEHLGIPVKRLNYCVNDNLFKDYGHERDIDVSFHCAGNGLESRKQIRGMLSKYCKDKGLKFASGILHITDYAQAMARSKIVVNWPRVPENKPHRIFDAMACGAALVTGPFPQVEGDNLLETRDYMLANNSDEIVKIIDYLLEDDRWRDIAHNGKKRVMRYHTWAIRAKQLKEILETELG